MSILLTENCIGCGACQHACIPGSIELKQEHDGFIRAYISEIGCTGCGRCKIVCPQLRAKRYRPEVFFAYQNPNSTELDKSQSGGAFLPLARAVIEQGGVVYGVQWGRKCSHVEFSRASTLEQVKLFSGSKYIPAPLNSILKKIKEDVKNERIVLFCGLPCQVAAIRNLFPHSDNLFLIELLCMGPMSPHVWNILRHNMPSDLIHFWFRDKSRRGWGMRDARYEFSDGTSKSFCSEKFPAWKIFASGAAMSSSCLNCKFRSLDRVADITLGDFWGIENFLPLPHAVRKRGISLVHAQTPTGERYLSALQAGILGKFKDFDKIVSTNGGYFLNSASIISRQKSFFNFSRVFGFRLSVWFISLLSKIGYNFPKWFS